MNSRLAPMQFSRPDDELNFPQKPPARYVRFGSYDIDLQRQELFREGLRVPLPRKVLEVLLILLEKPGDVVTREALRARLWPADSQVNYNANVNTTVNKLRQVLGDSTEQPTFVETIPRRGYSFIARTEYCNQPCARAADTHPGQNSASVTGPVSESRKGLFQATPQSAWFAIGVASLLLAGILLGAVAGFFAFHH